MWRQGRKTSQALTQYQSDRKTLFFNAYRLLFSYWVFFCFIFNGNDDRLDIRFPRIPLMFYSQCNLMFIWRNNSAEQNIQRSIAKDIINQAIGDSRAQWSLGKYLSGKIYVCLQYKRRSQNSQKWDKSAFTHWANVLALAHCRRRPTYNIWLAISHVVHGPRFNAIRGGSQWTNSTHTNT